MIRSSVEAEADGEVEVEVLVEGASVDSATVGLLWLCGAEADDPQEVDNSASVPRVTKSGSLFFIMHLPWTFGRQGVEIVGNHGEMRTK